ncbi:hypothetical protein P2318_04145 [Myxococcaceae bacterium GXIMD 01537]
MASSCWTASRLDSGPRGAKELAPHTNYPHAPEETKSWLRANANKKFANNALSGFFITEKTPEAGENAVGFKMGDTYTYDVPGSPGQSVSFKFVDFANYRTLGIDAVIWAFRA